MADCGVRRTKQLPSFRDGALAPDPESRDSGFDALHRPGMTTSDGAKCPQQALPRRLLRVAGLPPVVYFLPMTAPQQARESTPLVASAHDKILIVDFGSQVTQLIARRVREEGVYSEIVPYHKAEAAFKEMKPKAVILSGGPESVHEAGSPRAPQAIFDS